MDEKRVKSEEVINYLKTLLRDASVEPLNEDNLIIYVDRDGMYCSVWYAPHYIDWEEFVEKRHVVSWMYRDDLYPSNNLDNVDCVFTPED